MQRILITGTAGFIGFHLARRLLDEGHTVHGFDGFTAYYDPALKRDRHARLAAHPRFSSTEALLEDRDALAAAWDRFAPDVVVHLAAQAGVRYSLENPRAYVDSNVTGTFHVLELARAQPPRHLLIASTSSVYGANARLPFRETDKADTQLSIYAATKKATESLAHAYAHLWHIPTTVFRFFTVYGPWGRPDLALFKFTDAILSGRPIEIYNHGDMWRDFTYIDDLVAGVRALMDIVPTRPDDPAAIAPDDSLSPVAPYRIVNIGHSRKVRLLDFVEAIEEAVGRKAIRHYLPLQQGDVLATWADATLLRRLTGAQPVTDLRDGVRAFVAWYRAYYRR
ncbi:MAG: NAD-dependent epimerase/dehydratase family protein [Sphingomonadaceae bacterium]|uniref:NAD-dependent epimerase/dehydratase family protein n=1 Tax=Thermaurantiacus sp. TaxID=2820283 RepID=UPI00298EFA16|nr:NAD-dependent epimerase/dehydratase family protein [Thermaurantiacus sp.]MCS6987745.1 NAD-dependent epimerase/dehydratase family protein [Sphingomonadaceae bacterium]MDW8415035.1 NAD-dependent epimerase/dehydratase family protein [Thermaurantiacus sp.]